jgi:hypothetical protein
MKVAYDLFAETNPAFGVFTIAAFCRTYLVDPTPSVDVGLLYLAVPIAMSGDTQQSFDETNAKTGLLAWLTRYPAIRYDLGARLDASVPIMSASIRFGLSSRALLLGKDGTIKLGPKAPPRSVTESLAPGPRQVIRRAERLGGWMGKAGAAAAIFSAFGVSP